MRFDYEIRQQLNRAIDARREAYPHFKPSYQLVVSALAWSLGEGKKDTFVPGFGHPRGEYTIRKRIRECITRRERSRLSIVSKNWQIIISCLEWVLGDSEIMPLEARDNVYLGVSVG